MEIARNDFARLGRSIRDDPDAAYDEKREAEAEVALPPKQEKPTAADLADEAFQRGLLNGTINFYTGLPVN